MDETFVEELKAILYQLSDRVDALEETVNNTLIGGLKNAAATYKDNEGCEAFRSKYGEHFGDLVDRMKALAGDEYDVVRSAYDDFKTRDSYTDDEVYALIDSLKEKLGKAGGGVSVEIVKEEPTEEGVISVEQLGKELEDYKN